jgi:hypothetical protein
MLVDECRCQRCQLDLSKFPELVQLHHMIDREILWKAQKEGIQKKLQFLRRQIEYQLILCPACHAHIHGQRETNYFFPNYNLNTSGNNVKIALDNHMKVKARR